MRRAILIFLFLALAMTVMSAPAKKPRTICSRANKAALLAKSKGKKAGGVSKGAVGVAPAKAAPAKAAPAKVAPVKKGKVKRDFDADSDYELFRRAGETSLCGMNIRGSSSRMCQGNPGYFRNSQTGVSAWSQWDAFKSKITSANVPSRYQCDHALELQLTVRALTNAGFCQAWAEMEAAWKKLEPKKNVKQKMKDEFVRGGALKETANHPSMLFYIDTSFNEYKRAWVARFLRGAPAAASQELKGYFNANTNSIVDRVAPAIDTAAYNLLNTINTLATPADFDWDTASDEAANAVCELDNAQLVTYQQATHPVASWWASMKGRVHA